jgi:hypothetical protein
MNNLLHRIGLRLRHETPPYHARPRLTNAPLGVNKISMRKPIAINFLVHLFSHTITVAESLYGIVQVRSVVDQLLDPIEKRLIECRFGILN